MRDLTVVIPAFNAQSSIARAVASAKRCEPHEIIVVDDGSTDGTAATALNAGARVLSQTNSGAAVARRTGLEACTSEFVLFLDSDDEVVAGGVAASRAALARHGDAVAAIAITEAVGVTGEVNAMRSWPEGVSLVSLITRGHAPCPPGAVMWRTEAVRRAALAQPAALDLRYADDYELLLRGTSEGEIIQHASVGCHYTVAGGKSALSPSSSLQAAEELRAHYASWAGIEFRPRGRREMIAAVARRNAMESKANGRRLAAARHLTCAMLLDPRWALEGVRRRVRL